MGVEQRKGRLYLYDRRRVGGRLRAEYVGPLDPGAADLFHHRAAMERDRRETQRQTLRIAVERADAVLAAGAEFDRLADRVFRAVMHLTGHHLHHRGEWRRKHGNRTMRDM